MDHPFLDSLYYAKLEGPRWVTGCPRQSRGALGKKTLMLTITGQKARDRGKGSEQKVLKTQTAPGNFILDEERVAYQK